MSKQSSEIELHNTTYTSNLHLLSAVERIACQFSIFLILEGNVNLKVGIYNAQVNTLAAVKKGKSNL